MSKGRNGEIYFVTWLRAVAVALILSCHLASWSENRILLIMSQILNVGVPIFFILSGFLFGIGGGQNKNPVQWYIKRIKRIFIPYEIFMVVLLVLHIMTKQEIKVIQWVRTILGIQGFSGVRGAEQTWFITAILICYLVTPEIAYFSDLLCKKTKIIQKVILTLVLFLPALIPFIIGEAASFVTPIVWYFLAYFCGKNWNKIKYAINKSKMIGAMLIIAVMFLLRIIGRFILDGTILYDYVIVVYEHNIVAFCIAVIFIYYFSNKKPTRIVKTVSNISFEIYLYHCMFGVGPIKISDLTRFYSLNCVIIILLSAVIAYIMNKFSDMVLKKI